MKKIIFLLALITILSSCDIDGYGPKVKTNGVEVFYKPDSLKPQAESFSVMMDTMGYGKNGTVSFQILSDSIVHINMVVQDKYHVDETMDYSFNAIALLSSLQIFKENNVQMHLTDERFNVQRSLDVIKN